jgi:uncharacterized glyoxalase superfamily protein PhnB
MATRINAVGLIAADMARTIAFYERLGCTFQVEGSHASADLGGFLLMLDTAESAVEHGMADEASVNGPRPGMALAAQVDSPEAVDTLYAELTATGGGVHPPFEAPWGQRYATVKDPDGTTVDLYAWLPGRAPGA